MSFRLTVVRCWDAAYGASHLVTATLEQPPNRMDAEIIVIEIDFFSHLLGPTMPKKTPRHLLATASNARAARKEKAHPTGQSQLDSPVQSILSLDETDDEPECGYEGGVDNFISSESDDDFVPGLQWELEDGGEWDLDEELSEYDEEMMEQLKKEAAELVKPTLFKGILAMAVKNWQKVEANQRLGYNGQSKRTREQQEQQERLKRSMCEEAKTS